MPKTKIRKDDKVRVIAGANRGQEGRVLAVYPQKNLVLIEGVNYQTHHEKVQKTQSGQEGGIMEVEAPLHISNVMIIDPETNKPARIGLKTDENGNKIRYTKGKNASGAVLDQDTL